MRPPLWIRPRPAARRSRNARGLHDSTTNAPANSAAPTTAAVPGATASLVMLTEEYAPLNYHEDGRPAGIAIDLLDETLLRLGNGQSINEVRFLPWAVAYNRTLVETDTVLFATARLPSRETLFKWAGPIYPGASGSLRPSRAQHHDRLSVRTAGLPDRGGAGRCGRPETPRPRRARIGAADSGGSGGPGRDGSTRARSTSSPTGSSPDAGLPGARAGTRSGSGPSSRSPSTRPTSRSTATPRTRPSPGSRLPWTCSRSNAMPTTSRSATGPRTVSAGGGLWRGPCS